MTPYDWASDEGKRLALGELIKPGSVMDDALNTLQLINIPKVKVECPEGWEPKDAVLAEHMRQAGASQVIEALRNLPRLVPKTLPSIGEPWTYIEDPRPVDRNTIPKPKPLNRKK